MRYGNSSAKKTPGTATKPAKKKAAAKKKAVTKKTKVEAKAPGKINFLHVIVEVLAGDISSVGKFIQDNEVKAHVVRRAADELMSTHPEKGELFAAWVKANFPASGRGKTAPQLGETRPYKGQQITTPAAAAKAAVPAKGDKPAKPAKAAKPARKGPVFIRLPLDAIGCKKNGDVLSEYLHASGDLPDRIVTYLKPKG